MNQRNDRIKELRKKIIENDFKRMNQMQRQAVFCTEGPLLILAGAGSGKTTVLVNRIANLIKYGSAYNSERVPFEFSDEEIEELEACADKKTKISDELQKKLAVNAVRPWQILAITFTNKAAGELKERIAARIEDGGENIWASTFHSTCARILRRYGDRIGYTNSFTVYDTADQKRLIKDCLKSLGMDEKILPHRAVLSEISKAKDKLMTPQDFLKAAQSDSRLISMAKAYALYQDRLKSSDAMDFDDLLCKTVELFEKEPSVLEYYQNLFKYIMVDEYQDTNRVQYKFISMLADKNKNICVVGDDDQSIYKFRGATIENILSFEKTYKGAVVIRLEQNYRSTKNILNGANEVIKNNKTRKGKTLWTENDTGEKITIHSALNERDEAKYIADTILEQVDKGRKFSDFAVLYRMNAQSNAIEQYFSRSGIPHRLIGGHRFYDREEIKDMTSYLQVINNPSDDVRIRRIINKPKRKIGETTVANAAEIAAALGESIYEVIHKADEYDKLKRAAASLKEFCRLIDGLIEFSEDDDHSIEDLYKEILAKTNYIQALKTEKEDNAETKIENINELASNIINYENEMADEASLSGFLEDIALISDIDNYDADADSVVLMTLHSAKGLEFPVVFIPGMENNIFPGMQSMIYEEEMQEERRLAYVGITRAKEKLYIVHADERMLFGSTVRNSLSTFATELPTDIIERTGSKREFKAPVQNTAAAKKIGDGFAAHTFAKAAKKPQAVNKEMFKVGDTVKHKAFGTGLVVSSVPMGNDNLLEIAFDKVGTKKLMANFAPLEKQ